MGCLQAPHPGDPGPPQGHPWVVVGVFKNKNKNKKYKKYSFFFLTFFSFFFRKKIYCTIFFKVLSFTTLGLTISKFRPF
jgi:hypothetical protein